MIIDMSQEKKIFFEKINNAQTIAIFGHMRPDGDCVGSCLSLYNYIEDNIPGKEVTLYLQELPVSFSFLKNSDKICMIPDDREYDLGISLDCGDRDRHSEFKDIFGRSKQTICIDHHRSNTGFGDYCYVDPDASSCAEIMYRYYELDKISKECAECIYLGLIHDTGVFKYSSTSRETMICAGELMAKGIDTQFIIDHTFYQMTYTQNKLKAQAVLDSELVLDGQMIVTCVTKERFAQYNATRQDTDGIVDQIRLTEGIEVALFVYQLSTDCYKYSLRSIKKVDVSKIAVSFGGGGHIRAAGFELKGKYEDNLKKIIEMVNEQL